MQEVDTAARLDPLDRAIVATLALDARAGFRRIGAALSVSDRTVARRWARLEGEGVARVVGVVRPHAVGETTWHVRLRCAPDAAVRIAAALARRPDTSWVTLVSGGTEVACATRARTSADTDQLLLHDIPRTPRVLDVSAQCELMLYTRGETAYAAKLAAPAQRLITTPRQPSDDQDDGSEVDLDAVDHDLLTALTTDGRIRTEDLAARCGISASTVIRRIAALRRAGVLDLTVDVSPAALGHRVLTLARAKVTPDRLDDVARAVATHPQVGFAAATSGSTNLSLSILTPTVPALHRYLTDELAALPGIVEVETAVGIRRLKGLASPG